MVNPNSLDALRADISSALDLLEILIENAKTDGERLELLAINRALVKIATDIDNGELVSRNAAIAALVNELGADASDLETIHQQAVDLKNTLDIAQNLLTAFGNIANSAGSAHA